MNCWAVLQLADDADERSVKRSYARLLKLHRPDDEPIAFQRLREAYEQALTMVRECFNPVPTSPKVTGPSVRQEYWATADLRLPTESPVDGSAEVDVQPASDAEAVLRQRSARWLLLQVNPDNVQTCWDRSVAQGCSLEFEDQLAELCASDTEQHLAIAEWAVEHLQWLTPWQRVAMADEQRQTLAEDLLALYRARLWQLLDGAQEQRFFQQFQTYARQSWLLTFDRKLDLQRLLVTLLNRHRSWSLVLFDRICRFYDWDDSQDWQPQPALLWQELIRRCEREAYYLRLRNMAHDRAKRLGSKEENAAYLLLTPLSLWQQARYARQLNAQDWQACGRISELLLKKYPALIERLPNSDVWFWQSFMPRTLDPRSFWALGTGLGLAWFSGFLHAHGQPQVDLWVVSFFLALGTGCTVAVLARSLMGGWQWFSGALIGLDLWLTRSVLPKRFNLGRSWLLLRHGVPWLALALLVAVTTGVLGIVTYMGVSVLGRVEQNSPPLAPVSNWHKPWQWFTKVTGLSKLQTLYLGAMTVVTLVCAYEFPAFPWTTGLAHLPTH